MGVNVIKVNNSDTNYTHSIFDISEYHLGQTYENLSAALQDVPQDKHIPGMTIRFVQTSDNKYVQFRLMDDTWSSSVGDWQGIDDVPTAGSNNLVKSGGVVSKLSSAVKEGIFTDQKYINFGSIPVGTNISDQINNPGSTSNYSYSIMECKPYDVLYINAVKAYGSSVAPLCFVNANNEIIEKYNSTVNSCYVIAPQNTAKVIVNSLTDGNPILKLNIPTTINSGIKMNSGYRVNNIAVGGILTEKAYSVVDATAGRMENSIFSVGGYKYILITGTGGNIPRLYCFIDKDYTVLKVSDAYYTTTDEWVEIPESSVFCICNFNKTSNYGVCLKTQMEKNVFDTKADVSDLESIDESVSELVAEVRNMGVDETQTEEVNSILEGFIGYHTGTISQTSKTLPTGLGKEGNVITLNIHKGIRKYGTDLFNHVYIENCRDDFSDLRIKDGNGNILDYEIVAKGNYDFIPDTNLGERIGVLSDNSILRSNHLYGNYTKRSTDNGTTWTNIANGDLLFVFPNDDILTFYEYGVWLYTAASNYATSSIVLNCDDYCDPLIEHDTVVLQSQVDIDSNGNIYLGLYHKQSTVMGAQVLKSSDHCATWTTVFSTTQGGCVHTHTINVDRLHTPNVIYIGIDGGGNSGLAFKSSDGGSTWQQLNIPWVGCDYGLLFFGKGFRLGGGESDIQGGPAIYRTTDDVNFEAVIPQSQGIRRSIWAIGDSIFAAGCASYVNQTAAIYRSDDNGVTWKLVQTDGFNPTLSAGDGVNGVTDYFIPMGDTEKQVICGMRSSNFNFWMYPIRHFEGGEHHMASVRVLLKEDTNSLTVESGYNTPMPFRKMYDNNIVRTPIHTFTFGNLLDFDLTQVKVENQKIQRFGSVYPQKGHGVVGAKILKKIKLGNNLLPSNGFTISLWANFYGMDDYQTIYMLMGSPEFYWRFRPYNRNYELMINGVAGPGISYPYLYEDDNYHLIHIIVTSESNIGIQVDDNVIYFNQQIFQMPASTGDFFICGVGTNDSPDFMKVAQMKIYDKAFIYEDCVSEYNGFKAISLQQ